MARIVEFPLELSDETQIASLEKLREKLKDVNTVLTQEELNNLLNGNGINPTIILQKTSNIAEIEAAIMCCIAAEYGSADAQYKLGECYDYGRGVKKDKEKADRLYRKAAKGYQTAADQGDVSAQRQFGECCYYGRGVEADGEKAMEWYHKAAEHEDAEAQYGLGNCYRWGKKNIEKAIEWYHKAAKQGNANAQASLGDCYYYGSNTVKPDENEAKKWYQMAAEQGHIGAREILANLEK